MNANTASDERNRQPIDLLGQLSTLALGAAGGLAINTASPDVGYRGAAGALLVGMAISTIRWLRRLPQGAPLIRYSPAVLLGLALCSAILTLISPGGWATTSVMVGVGMATIAVLLPTDRDLTWRLLRGVAFIGVGAAFVSAGITTLHQDDTSIGVSVIGVGMALIGSGIAVLHGRDKVLATADIGFGVAFIGGGAALHSSQPLLRIAGVLVGVGSIAVGIATLRRGGALFAMSGPRDGGDAPVGMAGVLVGLGFIGMGIATMRGDDTLLAMAGMDGDRMVGIAVVGVGVAIIGVGIANLRGGAHPVRNGEHRLRSGGHWLRDPDSSRWQHAGRDGVRRPRGSGHRCRGDHARPSRNVGAVEPLGRCPHAGAGQSEPGDQK